MTPKKKTVKPKAVAPPELTAREVLLAAAPDIVGTTKVVWKETRVSYQCQFCPHATLQEREALDHFYRNHAPGSSEARRTGLVDRHGNEIMVGTED